MEYYGIMGIVNIITIVLEQSLIYMPLLFGAYISFSLMKTPDLSIESAYLFGALCAGYTLEITQGFPLIIMLVATIMASLLGGIFVGLTSSCITYFGNIPHLLSSIITFGLCHGLFQLFSNPYVSLALYTNPLASMPYIAKHPEFCILALFCCFIAIVFSYLLRTQLGYSFAIFGYNPQFFKHFKISTAYVFIAGIMLSNALAGLSGYFFAQTNNLIEINMGLDKVLFCITTLILGKAFMIKNRASIFVPICGLISYFFLQQLLLQVNFNLKYFTAIQAILVLIILLLIYRGTDKKIDQLGV